MVLRGHRYELGSLEESLAHIALQRERELEFLKINSIINAILYTGNRIAAAMSGDQAKGSDSVNKTLDALKKMLLPHLAEDTEKKAAQIKKKLIEEYNRGPLKIKVMENKQKRGHVRLRRDR